MSAFIQALRNNRIETAIGVDMDYVQAFANAYSAAVNIRCAFCGGAGHEHRECMTLIKWTRKARDCGFGFHWGALKGIAYYRAEVNGANGEAMVKLLNKKAPRRSPRKKN